MEKFQTNDIVTITKNGEVIDSSAKVVREIFVNNYIIETDAGEPVSPKELRIYRLRNPEGKYMVVSANELTKN